MQTNSNAEVITIEDTRIGLAPYVWKRFGSGQAARAEACMPGAYLKTVFQGSTALRLLVDGTANDGCPPSSMPVVEYAVDEGPFKVTQLTRTGEVYALLLAQDLARGVQHRLELYFRAADLAQNRWRAATAHLRIAGIELEPGGELQPPAAGRARKAIGFGDSITEGVGVDGLFTSWQSLEPNNARATWFPLVCAALDCDYGQLGSGGQGMVRPIEMPPLPQTWDHFDATTSRLTDGRLLPEPDYVFCCMGTNDFRGDVHRFDMLDISEAYGVWLADVRAACPHTVVFCVVPPLGWHAAEIKAAVTQRHQAGDGKVHLIDTSPLSATFGLNGATQTAFDGVHPSVYGNALLGALIAAEAQKVLSQYHE